MPEDYIGELVCKLFDGTRWLEIRRMGAPKKAGGTGVHWTCGCKCSYGVPCLHLRAVYLGRVTEDPAKARIRFRARDCTFLVEMTDFGREVLYADWAAKALAAGRNTPIEDEVEET